MVTNWINNSEYVVSPLDTKRQEDSAATVSAFGSRQQADYHTSKTHSLTLESASLTAQTVSAPASASVPSFCRAIGQPILSGVITSTVPELLSRFHASVFQVGNSTLPTNVKPDLAISASSTVKKI
jgi:hypothetical protein